MPFSEEPSERVEESFRPLMALVDHTERIYVDPQYRRVYKLPNVLAYKAYSRVFAQCSHIFAEKELLGIDYQNFIYPHNKYAKKIFAGMNKFYTTLAIIKEVAEQ